MWDMNQVVSIEHKGEFVYRIEFDDGMVGDVDFGTYLSRGPVFEALGDETLFRQAKIEGGTISWPNGADVAPESLYAAIESVNSSVGQGLP